jgi:hypothetical protein
MASGIHAYDLSSMLATFDPEKTSAFKYALSAFFLKLSNIGQSFIPGWPTMGDSLRNYWMAQYSRAHLDLPLLQLELRDATHT